MRVFRTSPRRAGVTLLELLIVVSMLGIIALVSTPRIGRSINSSRLEKAARVLALDLQLAPQLSARQRRPVKLVVDVTNKSYTVVDRATPTTVYVRRSLGSGTDFNLTGLSTNVTSNTLEFFPNGMTSGAMTVTLTMGSRTRTVKITTAGFVRM